jgi:hypothetical protein
MDFVFTIGGRAAGAAPGAASEALRVGVDEREPPCSARAEMRRV